jgi:hypothetical protein
MSSMIPQPPPSISVNGGDSPQGGDDANVVSLLKQALDLVNQAAAAEKDDIDTAAIHKIAVGISSQIAAEQKLTDDVMGAGPGVKMVRKTQGPAA